MYPLHTTLLELGCHRLYPAVYVLQVQPQLTLETGRVLCSGLHIKNLVQFSRDIALFLLLFPIILLQFSSLSLPACVNDCQPADYTCRPGHTTTIYQAILRRRRLVNTC